MKILVKVFGVAFLSVLAFSARADFIVTLNKPVRSADLVGMFQWVASLSDTESSTTVTTVDAPGSHYFINGKGNIEKVTPQDHLVILCDKKTGGCISASFKRGADVRKLVFSERNYGAPEEVRRKLLESILEKMRGFFIPLPAPAIPPGSDKTYPCERSTPPAWCQ